MAVLRIERLTHLHVGPVDLTVTSGSCVCISGPSGAGKTLLLRAVADLDPHEGEIWLDERACSTMPAHQWRRRVAYLPAESRWWAPTVGAHLSHVPDAAALATLGFEPDVLEWEVGRLSSGERQRLALLRLLGNEPQALLLDEPTAALDPAGRVRVETVVADYRRLHGAAVLWVSHDPVQIGRVADRHCRLEDGRLQPGEAAA